MKRILVALTAMALPFFAASAGAADGKTLFATCQACHGATGEGNRQIGAPNIAGMDAWYLERQLKNFAAGLRGTGAGDSFGMQMRAAVKALPTDADRVAIATYVAKLPRVSNTAAEKGDLSNGRNYFNSVCSACHTATGAGNQSLSAPRLAGIDTVYLARQFANFRSGARGYSADDKLGAQMRAIVGMVPVNSDRDVFAYIASLKP